MSQRLLDAPRDQMVEADRQSHLALPVESQTEVKFPAGTQPETFLRLRGKGLPEFESRRHGDLFVTLEVHIPEKLSREKPDLWRKLQATTSKTAAEPTHEFA